MRHSNITAHSKAAISRVPTPVEVWAGSYPPAGDPAVMPYQPHGT